jgi:hypothetical protein
LSQLSDNYPVGSGKWLSAKKLEQYNWVLSMMKSCNGDPPLNIKLDYALGWLDTEIPE